MDDSAKIRTYRRKRNEAWLKDHPEERWQCDILPFDGSDHHGIGATESEAIMNAALAYARWQNRFSPELRHSPRPCSDPSPPSPGAAPDALRAQGESS